MIRALALCVAARLGHHVIVGTPEEIANQMQLWFETRSADGFNVMPPYFPFGLKDDSRADPSRTGPLPVRLRRRDLAGLFRLKATAAWRYLIPAEYST